MNQRQKLLALVVLAALLGCSIGANITIYVDGNAGTGGDGNQSTPFSTLSDAFSYSNIISDSQLNYDYTEIVIASTSSTLVFPSVTILGPNTSSLTISSAATLPQGVILQPEDCNDLPTVQIKSINPLQAANLVSINFLGLNIQPIQSSNNSFFDLQKLTSIGLGNVCLLEDGATTALSTIISAFGIQNITVNSLFLSKIYPSIFLTSNSSSIALQNIQILQNLASSSINFDVSIFSFNTSNSSATGNVTMDTVSILMNSSTATIATVQVMSVVCYNSVSVSNLQLENSSFNASSDLFSLKTVGNVAIEKVSLTNLSMTSIGYSLFYMYNISAAQLDTVTLTQVVSAANISDIDNTGIETVFLYIFRIEEFNTTQDLSFLNNVLIEDSRILYIAVLKVGGDFKSFNLTNLTVSNSVFRYKILSIWKYYRYDNISCNYIPSTYWTTANFSFDNCSFTDVNLLSYNYYQDDEKDFVLAIGEPDAIAMSNITITNSVFTKGPEHKVAYSSYFFSSTGYRFEVTNLTFVNNTLNYYILFYQSTRLASMLIDSSTISNITLNSTMLFMMDYAGLKIPLIASGYFNSSISAIYPQYIVMLLAKSTVQNVITTKNGMNLVMSVATPYFFMDSNLFQNVTANAGRLFEAGSFTPIPTDNDYSQYQRNTMFEQLLFPNHPIMQYLFDNSTYDADASGLGVIFQYRFRNNRFEDNFIALSYSFTKIQSYGFNSSAIKWDQNIFLRNNLGPSLNSHLLWFVFDGHVEIKDNLFINTRNQGYLTIFESMTQPLFVNISNNTIIGQETTGLVLHRPESINTFYLSDNLVNYSVLYLPFINLMPVSSTNQVTIQRNTFCNLQVCSSNSTFYRINFIYLEIPKPYFNSSVNFSSNTLQNITFAKTDPYIKASFDNSLITMVLGNSTLKIWNCTFQDTPIKPDGSYLSLTAGTLSIINSTFSNIATSGMYGTVRVLSPNITIDSSLFTNNVGTGEVKGGAIYVDYDPTYQDAISLEITNSLFSFNTAFQGSILYMENTPLGLIIQNNAFVDNYASNSSSAIHLYNTNLSTFNLVNNTINATNNTINATAQVGTAIIAKNFLWFDKVQVQGLGYINSTNVYISGDISMNLAVIQTSSQLSLSINTIGVIQGQPISNSSSRRLLDSSPVAMHFTLINSDSGSIQLTDVNISNVVLSKASVFELSCSNQSNTITLIKSTLNNIVQISDLNPINISLVDRSDFLPNATTGGIFITSLLASTKTCNISINIQDSQFYNISQDGPGGVINDLSPGPTIINITSSNFTNITSGQGPVVSTYAPDNSSILTILDSTFQSNKAFGYGGVIFNFAAQINVSNSVFENNVASYSGGAIFSYYFENAKEILNQSGNSFINNTSLVKGGNNLGARPKTLQVNFSTDLNETGMIANYVDLSNETSIAQQPVISLTNITNITTYTLQKVAFIISIYDEIGQPIFDISSNISANFNTTLYLEVYSQGKNQSFASSDCTLVNNATHNGTVCYFNNKDIQINGKNGSPLGNITISYWSPTIYLNTTIQVQTRDCIPGEFYNQKDLTCTLCPPGKYSLNPEIDCDFCPDGATCPGGYNLTLREQYWRMNTSTDDILHCNGTAARCNDTYDSKCNQGFIGTLCGRCDLNNKYVRQGLPSDINCGKCPDNWLSILLNILWMLGMFCYNLYFIWNLVNSNREYYNAIKENWPTPPSTGPYIRSITTYWQIIIIVISFDAGFTTFLGFGSSDSTVHTTKLFYNQDCFFASFGIAPEDQLKAKIIFFLLRPPIELLIIASWYLIKWRGRLDLKRKIRLFVTWISIFILEQPGIAAVLSAYSNCTQIADRDPQRYVYANEFFECDTPKYNSLYYFVVLPFLNLYFWILPGVFLGVLLYHRRNLNSERLRLGLGGLYNEFTDEAFYWGIVIICFKLLLIAVNQIHDIKTKALILLLVFYCYKGLLSWKQPYDNPNLMKAENLSIYAYMVTVFSSYLFVDNQDYIKVVCLLGMLIANALAIGFIGKQMCKVYREAVLKQVDRLKKKNAKAIESSANISVTQGSVESPNEILTSGNDSKLGAIELPAKMPQEDKQELDHEYYDGNHGSRESLTIQDV